MAVTHQGCRAVLVHAVWVEIRLDCHDVLQHGAWVEMRLDCHAVPCGVEEMRQDCHAALPLYEVGKHQDCHGVLPNGVGVETRLGCHAFPCHAWGERHPGCRTSLCGGEVTHPGCHQHLLSVQGAMRRG